MNKLAKELVKELQDFHQQQKKDFKPFIHGSEAILLFLLNHNNATIPSEISDHLNITTARVAASLNRLEEKGFITRKIDTKDRRKINVKLTSLGEQEAQKIKLQQTEKLTNLLKALGKDDALEIIRLIKKIKTILSNGE